MNIAPMQMDNPPGTGRSVGGFVSLLFGGIFVASMCLGIASVMAGRESLSRVLIDYTPPTLICLLLGLFLYGWRRWKILLSIVFIGVGGLLLILAGVMHEIKMPENDPGMNDGSQQAFAIGSLKAALPVLMIGLLLLFWHRWEKRQKNL
jgi:predicted membrane channel-forming protein YqfA (hemolysin III family)